MNNHISEEMLNAYLDNELDEKDSQFVDEQIKNNSELQQKLKQLQDLKIKIRASYVSVKPPIRKEVPVMSKKHWLPIGLIASLTLVIGLTSGWYGNSYINNHTNTEMLFGVQLEQLKPEDNKIIIHVSQNDMKMFDKALNKAELFLARFEARGQQGKIQVMANSYGMDLLLTEKSPYPERINNLMMSYDNIEFLACKNTLKRLRMTGQNTDLLPGVKVHGPVINEIVSSLQNGWTYLKI
jgi:intracellular sulfur oxidation DsrE/DsrF family protein